MPMLVPAPRKQAIREWKVQVGPDHINFGTNRDLTPEEARKQILEAVDALLPEHAAQKETA